MVTTCSVDAIGAVDLDVPFLEDLAFFEAVAWR